MIVEAIRVSPSSLDRRVTRLNRRRLRQAAAGVLGVTLGRADLLVLP